jgi:hypothetical protein
LALTSLQGKHERKPQFVTGNFAERLNVFGLPDDFRAVDFVQPAAALAHIH